MQIWYRYDFRPHCEDIRQMGVSDDNKNEADQSDYVLQNWVAEYKTE